MKMVLDSSTTWTMVNRSNLLTEVKPGTGMVNGSTTGGTGAAVTNQGKLTGRIIGDKGDTTEFELENVKCAPDMEDNLLRVRELEKIGIHVDFGQMELTSKKTGKKIAKIMEDEFDLPFIWVEREIAMGRTNSTTPEKEHQRNGHLGEGTKNCKECQRSNMKRKKIVRKEEKKSYKFGEVLSLDTDVMSTRSIQGHRYREC